MKSETCLVQPLGPFIRYHETLNYDLSEVHQQHTRAARSLGRPTVSLSFTAHQRDFKLRLTRDTSAFLPDFTLVTSDGEEQSPDVSYFYSGDLEDEPGSYCHGSITDGLFQGKIHVGDDVFSVEPSTNYIDEPETHSVIYKAKDLDYSSLESGGSGCGMIGEIQKRMEEKMKKLKDEEDMLKAKNQGESDKSSHSSRHKRAAPSAQTCTLYIQTDIQFYERYGRSRSAVIKQIGEHVQAASNIYSRVAFGEYQNINFAVKKIRVFTDEDTNSVDYLFKDDFIGVEKYLDLASIGNLEEYCLAYTFTNRDFANGVLGLAWIATEFTSSTGGLCSPKLNSRDSTLNTGIVTVNNYGSFVPPLMSHNTFAHEIGHNFGSNHDPANNQVCSPGGSLGNYLMFPHASSGGLLNNAYFSSCSINEITGVLQTVFAGTSKENCFVERSSVTFCGNQILEEGEECDCGYDDTCPESNCCVPQNADNTNPDACTLKSTSVCSEQQGDCCNPDTCDFWPLGFICNQETDCSQNAMCNGNSFVCIAQAPKADNTPCDGDRKVCSNGACTKSICEVNTLEECHCTQTTELCEICCQNRGQPESCVSASQINIRSRSGETLFRDVGSTCDNFMGYCDAFNTCRLADEDGPIASIIRKIFFGTEAQLTDVIWTWITNNWWVIVIIVVAIIILMVLIIFFCERVIPTTNPWHKEKAELSRSASANVKLQKKRNRGSAYYGPADAPNFQQHPDNAESRATRF
ncbi:disintegrin and metalloproteinase domain-containing protein 10-like isoform X2 [Asterias amurensis]|uniref:disintegrin and metalloproteinase domain-containing protein 10-like isoform X2 n=1 Tax=Asterias amurensis TaxID=7602 RepID=UPI003AB6CA20